MTPQETLDHLRALTDPTPGQLREASDLALETNPKYREWMEPNGFWATSGYRPNPCADIQDAVRWMVPEEWSWGRSLYGEMWMMSPKGHLYVFPEQSVEGIVSPCDPALALTIAGLAAILEGEKC